MPGRTGPAARGARSRRRLAQRGASTRPHMLRPSRRPARGRCNRGARRPRSPARRRRRLRAHGGGRARARLDRGRRRGPAPRAPADLALLSRLERATAAPPPRPRHRASGCPRAGSAAGVAVVAAAAVAWGTAGYVPRLVPVALFAMLVWRNVFGGSFMPAYVFATQRRTALRSFADLGVVGWLAALVNGLSMICYLAALRHTSVANVAVIYATAPFGAAAIAWLAYRDRASTRTLLAGLLALAGVAITVGGT